MKYFTIKTSDEEFVGKFNAGENALRCSALNSLEDRLEVDAYCFLILGGDNPGWNIGLAAICKIKSLPLDKGYDQEKPKNYRLDIEVLLRFEPPISREAFGGHRETFNTGVGPMTKGERNQALGEIKEAQFISVCKAVREIMPERRIDVDRYLRDILDAKSDLRKLSSEERERLYKNWIVMQVYEGDTRYSQKTATSYASCLKNNLQDVVFLKIPIKNIFEVASYEEMKLLEIQIKAVEGFEGWVSTNHYALTSAIATYSKFLEENATEKKDMAGLDPTGQFGISSFQSALELAGLQVSNELVVRFVSALITKPFVLLTGLSGSGKTKLAQAFAEWIAADKAQYKIVPVGADWTNREPLLGYPNALETGKYVQPDSDVLSLLLEASKPENENKPFFLILDEMNLSHVERYFADFLSVMESENSTILLHPKNADWQKCEVPSELRIPNNLFIIGTVNIDETTYMFSPKVLDRAGVIEFRIGKTDMEKFLKKPAKTDLNRLKSQGAGMADAFIIKAKKAYSDDSASILQEELNKFFGVLKPLGAEFGYRAAAEIFRFAAVMQELQGDLTPGVILDAALIQKILPKLHGSRRKMEKPLEALGGLCLSSGNDAVTIFKEADGGDYGTDSRVKLPLSFEKIKRMYNRAQHDGFTSFAEA